MQLILLKDAWFKNNLFEKKTCKISSVTAVSSFDIIEILAVTKIPRISHRIIHA